MRTRRWAALWCLAFGAAFITGIEWPALGATEAVTKDQSPGEYKLVWADEFNRDSPPDPNNWVFEQGFVRNEELQWYQPENASCKDGLLVIEARREHLANPSYDPNSRSWRRSRQYAEYTSACLTTRRLHSWTYGRFEMRGRIDTRPGMWPAFWTLGSARPWPGCGEIDIMEYYRGLLLANACWEGQRRGATVWDDLRKPITEFGDPNWSAKSHIWRMDWDKDQIQLYIDNQLLNTVDLSRTVNGVSQVNPFHEPHYILLNLAIGGTSGGDPSQTSFPARFEIDYVRVYQKPSR
jgi:beta-glucanase (GH16 family)